MRTVKIEFSPDGEVKIDAIGFTGSSCRDITGPIMKALNGDVTKDDPKFTVPASGSLNKEKQKW